MQLNIFMYVYIKTLLYLRVERARTDCTQGFAMGGKGEDAANKRQEILQSKLFCQVKYPL